MRVIFKDLCALAALALFFTGFMIATDRATSQNPPASVDSSTYP